MKPSAIRAPIMLVGLMAGLVVQGHASVSQAQKDIIVSPAYIKQKVEEAKAGKLDHSFAGMLGEAGDAAFDNAMKNRPAKGWLDSAGDKYEAVLSLYEAGNAEPVYRAVAASRLGAVRMHQERLEAAEQLFRKCVDVLEAANPDVSSEHAKREYVFGLGFLGRVYRLQERKQLASETLDKALKLAQRYFGSDSPEVAALTGIAH
jgi:tetratricopeptide (TPR) repeat protein